MKAFKNGVSVFEEDTMNALISLQDFALVYAGTLLDSKTGSGVTENSLANNSYCARFTLVGSTVLDRIEAELDRDAVGADLVVQIRSGMVPGVGTDGTLLKEIVIPKEFIPLTAAYCSIPINLSGLTSGGTYWIVMSKAGDATNKIDWIGEASQDASYPAYYRSGGSGAWTANNALHFMVYAGTTGLLYHATDADGFVTLSYLNNNLEQVHLYASPPDGTFGGIRDIMTFSYVNGIMTGGETL